MNQSAIERLYELCCGVENDISSAMGASPETRLMFLENAAINIAQGIDIARVLLNEVELKVPVLA